MPPQPTESFTPATSVPKCPWYQPLCQITPLSKYLAMVIFIAMPFVGGYIGYRLAPEKVVEVSVPAVVPVLKTQKAETDIPTQITDYACHDGLRCFPNLAKFTVGQRYGDFVFATATIIYGEDTLGRDENHKIPTKTQLTAIFTGTTTLAGKVTVSVNEIGNSNMVLFSPDETSKKLLPNWSDAGAFANNSLTIKGLEKLPYVVHALSLCVPNEYCHALSDLKPEPVTIEVSGYSVIDFYNGTWGVVPSLDLVRAK